MSTHANLFAISYTAFQAAGAIRGANEFFGLIVVANLVVDFRPGKPAGFDAKVCEQLFRDRAARYARRSFTRRRALKHVSEIVRIIFQSAGQIGVARTRTFYATRFFGRNLARVRRHYFIPVGPVLVFDHQSQRRPERETMPHTTEDLDLVLLDLHAPAASVALLA